MPQTVTITKTLYTFDELSDDAKEKARTWWREGQYGDNFFAECVIDDAKEIAALFGLNIDEVYWSGFSSQGDGACFTGVYSYRKGALAAVKAHAPQDETLLAIVSALSEAQRKGFYSLGCIIRHRGRYSHEMSMQFDCEYAMTTAQDEAISEPLRDYARWIYRRLEDEYNYTMADEQVDESIRINEYTFNEEGRRDD
jgi:hypothetical protein